MVAVVFRPLRSLSPPFCREGGKLWGHMADDDHLYRRSVGVVLLNREGKVFVGARIDTTDEAWQMPQGGIDKGEEPWPAALRELEEETGIPPHLVERIAVCPERLKYRLPDELIGVIWKEPWV